MRADEALPAIQRCAIYTRKSVDHGFDKEFNSLETQRTICSAYITSQGHKGWREVPTRYDDGGQSGASLARPQLQALLTDIEAGLIDIVVVYKLDRITRSLTDFIRLMESFEKRRISLVSITQMFDSSESMGRLILNVLLTFAQFEREIAADRMRDKQRVVRRSGRWYGGRTPLGYISVRQILRVDPKEAASVRFIFEKFVQLGTIGAVVRECEAHDIKSHRFKSSNGRWHGGGRPGANSVRFVLDNPAYVGLLRIGTELVPGLHEPIIEQSLWNQAQELRRIAQSRKRQRANNLLSYILKDCFGRSMSIDSHGGRHFYVSNINTTRGRVQNKVLRVRKDSVERLVCATLKDILSDKERLRAGLLRLGCYDERLERLCRNAKRAAQKVERLRPGAIKEVIRSIFPHIELGVTKLRMVLSWRSVERFLEWDGLGVFAAAATTANASTSELLEIPCCRVHRSVLAAPVDPRRDEEAKPSKDLLKLLSAARRAQNLVETNRSACVSDLAKQMQRKREHFIRLLWLNYLAPDIVTSILDGTQPPDLTATKLLHWDLPLDWSLQRQMLGFAARPTMHGF